MKLIAFPDTEKQLIQNAIQNNRIAQKQLFERYAPKMLSICRQYISDLHFAEDVMITAFTKAFRSLSTFDTDKNFATWLRKITVNESISYLRQQKMDWQDLDENQNQFADNLNNFLDFDQIQSLIDQLPTGYKTVFLLYAVEGYQHQEIAELLHISEGTSKSQLYKARMFLQQQLKPQKLSYGKS